MKTYLKKNEDGSFWVFDYLPKQSIIKNRLVSLPTMEQLGAVEVEYVKEPISSYQIHEAPSLEIIDGVETLIERAVYRPLEDLIKEAKQAALNAQDDTLSMGYESSLGFKVKCTVGDLGKFTSELFGMFITEDSKGYCYGIDGKLHILSLAEYKILAGELRAYVLGIMAQCTERLEAIKACESPEQLIALVESFAPKEAAHE